MSTERRTLHNTDGRQLLGGDVLKVAVRAALIASAVFGCMLLSDGALGTKAYADTSAKNISMTINNNTVQFSGTVPILEGGENLYVPLRAFADQMNYDLEWSTIDEDHLEITITDGSKKLRFRTGDSQVLVDGQAVQMGDGPWSYQNNTYIPFRFLIDQMNLQYKWDSSLTKSLPSVSRYKEVPEVTTSSVAPTTKTNKILNSAYSYLGVPYVWGGTSPNGFDCSGFVNYVFRKNGTALPRTAHDIYKSLGTLMKNPQKGDLVFFSSGGSRITHVGIYVGDNKFIEANSGSARSVKVSSMGSNWAQKTYVGAKRA